MYSSGVNTHIGNTLHLTIRCEVSLYLSDAMVHRIVNVPGSGTQCYSA